MTWQWRRQGRIPLVNIVAGKNSSNRETFCKKDSITALRKDQEGHLAEGLLYLTEGLLYLAEGLPYLAEGLSYRRTSAPCRRTYVPCRRTLYLAEGGPKNGHPIKVLLLGLETPGDPEVLLSVWTWVIWGQVRCLQHPQVLVHPQIGCQKVPMY